MWFPDPVTLIISENSYSIGVEMDFVKYKLSIPPRKLIK